MPTGWDSILTVISFGDYYTDGLEMLLCLISNVGYIDFNLENYVFISIKLRM